MFIVGFDLGKRNSQICVQNADGTVAAELRIKTTRDDIVAALKKYPGRVLIESSTSADWVASALEGAGHEVVVADPRFSLMYAQRNKKIKTDRRDARALADALRLGAFRPAHRKSPEARALYARLLVRQTLIKSRTRMINQVRSLCERAGVQLRRCGAEYFHEAHDGVAMEQWLFDVLAPIMDQIEQLTARINASDKELTAIAKADPVARNLLTARGVGPLTALAFRAVVDDPRRFESAQQLSAYLGLVPSERSSGDKRSRPGAITKSGDPLLRYCLYEGSHAITKRNAPESNLKRWHAATAARCGKRKANVALARRMSRILWAMWRDNTPFTDALTAPQTGPTTTSTNATSTKAA
jgi:transposase